MLFFCIVVSSEFLKGSPKYLRPRAGREDRLGEIHFVRQLAKMTAQWQYIEFAMVNDDHGDVSTATDWLSSPRE
jgi:hypothetical protein